MRAIVAVISIGLLACGHPTPVPVAYETTVVKASYGRTWAATLEEFSSRSIPLKSADRVSGVIITDVLHLDPSYYPGADCGDPGFGSSKFVPSQGTFSALVCGDSTQSNVRVSARWISVGSGNTALCSTRGVWEQAFQNSVRSVAEKK